MTISKDPKLGLLMAARRRELTEVTDPNLLREVFPYSQVPHIVFDGQGVPLEPAPDFFITDTTFRDGQQARPPYRVSDIVALYDMMSRLGGPNGVIRASEFFLYSDKDKEAVEKCLELGYKYPQVTGWIRASKEDFKLVTSMGLKETGILTSASDYHIFLKLKKTRSQMLDHYLDLVTTALESDLEAVRCHMEDITRADFEGFIIPFVQRLMDIARQSGKAVKIRLCDTMGYGVPYAEAALPRSIPKMIHAMVHECGVPNEWLEWHGHNDFHKVLVNGTTAWLYGCAAANCALLGFGERTGNPPLEGAIIDYIALKGDSNGIDTRVITEIADYFRSALEVGVADNYPLIGANFNVTSAGIHADGMLKNEEIYNIFDTTRLLNRPPRVNVTDKSGIAGIAHWVNSYLGLRPELAIDKRHPGLASIADWIRDQYASGRVTSISDPEMLMQARMHLPEHFKSDFDRLREHALDLCERIILDLAENPLVESMDHASIEQALGHTVEHYHFIQFIYVTNTDGIRITRNVTQPEYRAEFEAARENEDLSDRDWFSGALKSSGQVFVSDFYKSRFTGYLCLTVSAPIVDDDGAIIGVLGADLRFEELARIL